MRGEDTVPPSGFPQEHRDHNKVVSNHLRSLETPSRLPATYGTVEGMKLSHRATVAALSTALVITGTSTVASAQPALPPQIEQASSQAQQLSSDPFAAVQDFRLTLPPQAYELAEKYNFSLPEFLAKPAGHAPKVAGELGAATTAHLEKAGHRKDTHATAIAQEWANQGAAGKLDYKGGVAHGLNHKDEGQGSVHRLTEQQAQDRLNWFNRDVPVNAGSPHGFGVATAYDGTYIYVAEFFLN